jgi:nitrogen fixation protein NifB
MRHCKRCRADAVGLLGMDRSAELSGCLSDCSDTKKPAGKPRPYVAVATLEGMLVNQHLGEALQFQIWGPSGEGFAMIEERLAPNAGGGPKRWYSLADTLSDCRAVLVSGIGDTPAAILQEEGVEPIEMVGLIEEGLKAVYVHGDFRHLKKRSPKACGSACKGDGGGCG